MPPTLFLMYGHPGVGKSYFGERLAIVENATYLGGDRIRHELFPGVEFDLLDHELVNRVFRERIVAALSRGENVVVDSTNNNIQSRHSDYEKAHSFGAETLLVVVTAPVEVALQRLQTRLTTKDPNYPFVPTDRMRPIRVASQGPFPGERYVVMDSLKPAEPQLQNFRANIQIGPMHTREL